MHVIQGYYWLWINNLDEIFQSLLSTFSVDEQIIDCLNYIKHTTIRENYSTSWTAKWDWKTWEEGGELKEQFINITTIAGPIKWTPAIHRVEHSTVDGRKFNLQNYNPQQCYQKN
jgi:hypothetical protein